jgi:hypothetical protein
MMGDNMRITYRAIGFFCGVIILASNLSSCNLGNQPVTNVEVPPEEPSEPMIPADEPPPGGEVHIGYFVSHRTEIHPGECTALEWHVEGGFGISLNGQQVNSEDIMEVCPAETTEYWLAVDQGDKMVTAQVTVHVESPSQLDSGDPPPEPTQPTAPQEPTPTSKPPAAKAPTTPQNCNKSSNEFITDLAITDIYPGNTPKGQFWVRITNHGPVACENANFKFLGCASVANPKSGGSGIASFEKVPVTINIKPGETQDIPTGIDLDFDKASYMVTCHFAAEIGYTDPNNSNQNHQEILP